MRHKAFVQVATLVRRCVNEDKARNIAHDAASHVLGPELVKVGKELDVRLQVRLHTPSSSQGSPCLLSRNRFAAPCRSADFRREHPMHTSSHTCSASAAEVSQVWLGKIGDLLDRKADTKAVQEAEARLRDAAHARLDELARPLEQQVEEASAALQRSAQEASGAQAEVRQRVAALEATVQDGSQVRRCFLDVRHFGADMSSCASAVPR